MFVIVDERIPQKAKEKLSNYTQIIELNTKSITYSAISGHPDIFMTQVNRKLILSPNCPQKIKKQIKAGGADFIEGQYEVENQYPGTAGYNACVLENKIIHNFKLTDPKIIEQTHEFEKIQVSQGYTRCNLIGLKKNHFMTSDLGIAKTLSKNYSVLYIDPKEILLNGLPHGFFGGCVGIKENVLFMLGSMNHIKEKNEIKQWLTYLDYELIELYNGPLFDGGSLIFL